MRKLKQIIACLLLICLTCSGMSFHSSAASGEVQFSDPSTAVGEQVDISIKLIASDLVGHFEMTVSYDPEYLQFISGDNATAGDDGVITITQEGTGAETELDSSISFYALQEGSSAVSISAVNASDYYGNAMDVTEGSSAVTIAEGDASKIPSSDSDKSSKSEAVTVTVDEKEYQLADFDDIIIPEGFSRDEISFEGEDVDCITMDNGGLTALYVQDPEDEENAFFVLYDSSTGAYTPMKKLDLTDTRYIILLRDTEGELSLPSEYQETTFTYADTEFPAWQVASDPEYYYVYAVNADGDKEIYRYDTVDQTYQRATVSTNISEEGDSSATTVESGSLQAFVIKNLNVIAIAIAVIFFLLLFILLIVRIKLSRRDIELDQIYDEYGIDVEEEEEVKPKKKEKKEKKQPKKQPKKEKPKKEKPVKKKAAPLAIPEEEDEDDIDEDDFEETSDLPLVRVPASTSRVILEEDDDEDDLEYEDDFEDDDDDDEELEQFEGFDDLETEEVDDFEEDDFEEESVESEASDDDVIDDLDELLSGNKAKMKSHMDEDDTFKVDFIDLD